MMTKMRKFLAVMAVVVLALSLVALAACADKHQHTFSDAWEKDETYHWHKATCEHTDQVSDKAAHDFDANGKCTVCDYQKITPDQHTHTYTTGWWSNETDHWHAATCEHADLTSDTAAHVYNVYGRCTVCNYQGEVPYNASLTATQFAAAMRDAANADSFTMLNKDGDEILLKAYVDGNLLYIYDIEEDCQDHGKVDADFEMEIEVRDTGMAETSTSCMKLEEIKEQFEVVMQALQSLQFDQMTYSEEKGCYVILVDETEVQLKFVEDKLYSVETEYLGFVDIDNTIVDSVFEHVHDFTTYYETSSMYHWYAVRCQAHQDEIVEKQPHAFGADDKCTVCGFAKPTEVNRQVTAEQWRDAFAMKGILNMEVLFDEEYAARYGVDHFIFAADGIGMSAKYNEYVQFLERGKAYIYHNDYDDTLVKAEGTEFDYWEGLVDRYYYVWIFGTVGDLFDQFQYDAATGRYVGDASLWDEMSMTGPAYVTFYDGELEKLEFPDVEMPTVIFGKAHVEFPDLPLHEHTLQLTYKDNKEHVLRCTECGDVFDPKHTFENGVCTVCGVKEVGKDHEHDLENALYAKEYRGRYDDEWVDYHYVVCSTCGAYLEQREHVFVNGTCTLCGEKQHTHTFVLDEKRTNEISHTLVCSDPECGYMEKTRDHTYNEDENKCDVCGQARHWHESDDWVKREDSHEGTCKTCGYYVYEEHVFVDNVCKVCGAMRHSHTWGTPTQLDDPRDYDYGDRWEMHRVVCTVCGVTAEQEHDFSNGDVCACGFHRHVHTATDNWERTVSEHRGYCNVCKDSVYESHRFVGDTCEVCGVKDHEHTWGTPTQMDLNLWRAWEFHLLVCTDCGATDEQEHDFSNGDVCACGFHKHEHTVESWNTYAFSHYGVCTECGHDVSGSHDYDENYDCKVCGYHHEHNLYYYDDGDTQHSVSCPGCGYEALEDHTYEDGSDTCICGHRKDV